MTAYQSKDYPIMIVSNVGLSIPTEQGALEDNELGNLL